MKKVLFGWVILALLVYPFGSQAQRRVYPHLQIFLLSSGPRGGTSFIAFWENGDQLAAGPFPVRLLELAGLNVFLDLSYPTPDDKLPSAARLKITRHKPSSTREPEGPPLLDKMADRIVGRGVSKMFPDWPFLVVGHNKPSEGVLWVGNKMRDIQSRILACDQEYRKALETTLNSMTGTASYDHAVRAVESAFPSCPP